jgi:predicted MFS family arabinose efflux permease
MLVGLVTFIWLPDSPSRTLCLSERERELASSRIQKRIEGTQMESFSVVITSRIAWGFAIIFLLLVTPLSTIGYYLPTLIGAMGFSTLVSNLLTVPVYACAFVSIIAFSRVADVYQCHGVVVMICASLAIVGFGGLILGTYFSNAVISLLFITIANVGIMSAIPPNLAWVSQHYSGR